MIFNIFFAFLWTKSNAQCYYGFTKSTSPGSLQGQCKCFHHAGKIHYEAIKHYGIIIVLDYGIGERKLKIEISNRLYDNHYEIKNYLGLLMRVMVKEDMFAHKLCALLDRTEITGRDVFDCWFFLKERTSINKGIVESRMEMPIEEYLDKCIANIQEISEKSLISGLGELTEDEIKNFVRHSLKDELISLLTMFKAFPSFT